MKKLLLIATFAFVGAASFASNKKPVTVKKVGQKKEIVKPSKGTSYPVTLNLSCGTVTFQSNCSGPIASCIAEWNLLGYYYEAVLCN